MKKYIYILSAIAAAVACSPQEMQLPDDTGNGGELTLNAFFEDIPTKSTLVDGTKVYWVPGDEIKVFAGNSSARFTTDIKENSAECGFTGNIGKADKYLALYPYKDDASYDGSVIKATLPATQDGVEGNVANGYLYSAGVSSADGSIRFRNLVSGICFSVKSEGVAYVELRGNDGEVIAGGFKATVGDSSVKVEAASTDGDKVIRLNAPGGSFRPGVNYYIVCIPTVFEKGITLNMVKEDERVAQLKLDRKVDLKRSVFGRISSADEGLAYRAGGFPEGELPQDNEIWYTTADKKPITNVENQSGYSLVSHTFENGMGVLRFGGPLTRFDILTYVSEDLERLTGILVPDCVEIIGSQVFWEVPMVTEFRVPASLRVTAPFTCYKQMALERFYGNHVSEDERCIVIDGIIYAFAPAGISHYEIPSGTVIIGEGAFANTKELKSVVIPSCITTMERSCFSGSSIESVTIPASVKSMDLYSFLSCHNLKNLIGDSPFISKDRKYLFDPYAMYPNTLFYFAGRDDTSYEIPEGVMAVSNYAFDGCENLRSVTFPKSLVNVSGEAFSDCVNLENLYGPYTTSDHKGLVNYGTLQFVVPTLSGDYVVPDEVTALGGHVFASKPGLRSVTMGDQVKDIGMYAFAFSHELRSVTLSANLVSMGYNPFQFCDKLESVYFRSILPPACASIEDTGNPLVTFYVPSKSYMIYTSDAVWKPYREVMKPFDYTDLPEPDFYISEDYSKDGEVTEYQKASKGNGIDIVFIGDAYSDRQIASGMYLGDLEACIEEYFAVEPYKSFRELFNIYIVTAVSATEGYSHGGRSLGTVLLNGTAMEGNDEKCLEFARKAVGDDKRMDEVLVIVCGNQDLDGTVRLCGTCYFYYPEVTAGRDFACGPAVTYFLKMDRNFSETGKVLRHESGGHGFAKLADEYHYSGNLSVTDRELIRERSRNMWYSNVDITSDPGEVKWARFLADPRYKDEVGIYEGGFTYMYNVWRPSENSIMNDNEGGFNAPSRYTIWYRIHKLAYGKDWNGTYEDFAAYDAVNRKKAGAAAHTGPLKAAVRQAPTGSAPVVTGRTWREAGK
ncbi:MAG: leucine-rich repeat protein [Bacteroidales bacterium]|nr:leucine-rich repeat protein [Bacteroidales bacterium]